MFRRNNEGGKVGRGDWWVIREGLTEKETNK